MVIIRSQESEKRDYCRRGMFQTQRQEDAKLEVTNLLKASTAERYFPSENAECETRCSGSIWQKKVLHEHYRGCHEQTWNGWVFGWRVRWYPLLVVRTNPIAVTEKIIARQARIMERLLICRCWKRIKIHCDHLRWKCVPIKHMCGWIIGCLAVDTKLHLST